MNSTQINYFLITARNRSFSKAAEECFITQPSLSKQIKNLENELGVELFDRSANPVRLTSVGNMYYKFFSEYTYELERIQKMTTDPDRIHTKMLRIGILSGLHCPELFHQQFLAFHHSYPDIQLYFENHNQYELIKRLKQNLLDVCLTFSGLIPNTKELFQHKLFHIEKYIVYSSLLHPTPADQATASDFINDIFYCVGDESNIEILDFMLNYCQDYHIYPKVRIVPNIESVMTNVEFGNGVTIVDGLTQFNESERIRKIRIHPDHIFSSIWMNPNITPEITLMNSFLENTYECSESAD